MPTSPSAARRNGIAMFAIATLGATGTAPSPPVGAAPEDWAYLAGDVDRDGISDVIVLKLRNTGTGRLEVHVLSGASDHKQFIVQTGTPLELPQGGGWAYAAADMDRDGIPDVVAIKKRGTGTRRTELHVLSGARGYAAFSLQTGTALHETDTTWSFAAGDMDGDGTTDVAGIKRQSTGSGRTEVHVLSGAASFASFNMQTATEWPYATDGTTFLAMDVDGDARSEIVRIVQRRPGEADMRVDVGTWESRYVRAPGTRCDYRGRWDERIVYVARSAGAEVLAVVRGEPVVLVRERFQTCYPDRFIRVVTGNDQGAGTDATIEYQVRYAGGTESAWLPLHSSRDMSDNLEAGTSERYVLTQSRLQPAAVRLRNDGSGPGPAWQLDRLCLAPSGTEGAGRAQCLGGWSHVRAWVNSGATTDWIPLNLP